VTNAWYEPQPGWINNPYSITSILRTSYVGYDKVGLCDIDIVPVDMCVCGCVNAIIVVAWEKTKSDNTHDSQTSMPSGRDSNSE